MLTSPTTLIALLEDRGLQVGPETAIIFGNVWLLHLFVHFMSNLVLPGPDKKKAAMSDSDEAGHADARAYPWQGRRRARAPAGPPSFADRRREHAWVPRILALLALIGLCDILGISSLTWRTASRTRLPGAGDTSQRHRRAGRGHRADVCSRTASTETACLAGGGGPARVRHGHHFSTRGDLGQRRDHGNSIIELFFRDEFYARKPGAPGGGPWCWAA